FSPRHGLPPGAPRGFYPRKRARSMASRVRRNASLRPVVSAEAHEDAAGADEKVQWGVPRLVDSAGKGQKAAVKRRVVRTYPIRTPLDGTSRIRVPVLSYKASVAKV